MSKRLYNNRETFTSQSIMTFKDYYMKFIGINDSNLSNGWGWFVDIELNSEPIRSIQNNNKTRNNIAITKKEYSSIRSMKSMNNLYDTSMMFDMDEFNEIHKTNNYIIILTNLLCIIVCGVYYYIMYYM